MTIADDLDLTPLAKLGRRLQGRAQGSNRGADIFLADTQNRYLGRICHWKECGPGIRQSCFALHCGQRHYLYDDLQRLELPRAVIEEPAIELWPRLVTRVPVPQDVKVGLLDVLEMEQGS